MKQHFLKSYTELLIQTCHRRGVHAMGGMVCNLSSPLCLDKMLNVDTKHNKWFHIQDQFCGYQM
jgi:malate synthase